MPSPAGLAAESSFSLAYASILLYGAFSTFPAALLNSRRRF